QIRVRGEKPFTKRRDLQLFLEVKSHVLRARRMGPRAHSPCKGFFKPRTSAGITYTDIWRKGWDSNPRYPCRHAGFQDRCLKPLGHPSVAALQSFSGTDIKNRLAAAERVGSILLASRRGE